VRKDVAGLKSEVTRGDEEGDEVRACGVGGGRGRGCTYGCDKSEVPISFDLKGGAGDADATGEELRAEVDEGRPQNEGEEDRRDKREGVEGNARIWGGGAVRRGGKKVGGMRGGVARVIFRGPATGRLNIKKTRRCLAIQMANITPPHSAPSQYLPQVKTRGGGAPRPALGDGHGLQPEEGRGRKKGPRGVKDGC
jgi:hypothetical protein